MPSTHLDAVLPQWQFREYHSRRVDAPPQVVFDATLKITANEIRFFKTLTAIRRGGRKAKESILNAPGDEPILDVATRSGFEWRANDPPCELVVGTRIGPNTYAAMNFLFEPDDRGGTIVSTETRVYAATPRARRAFALYWFAIRLGSGLIRREWLRAIEKRAHNIGR